MTTLNQDRGKNTTEPTLEEQLADLRLRNAELMGALKQSHRQHRQHLDEEFKENPFAEDHFRRPTEESSHQATSRRPIFHLQDVLILP